MYYLLIVLISLHSRDFYIAPSHGRAALVDAESKGGHNAGGTSIPQLGGGVSGLGTISLMPIAEPSGRYVSFLEMPAWSRY